MSEDKREQLQRLETALSLREEAAYKAKLTRYLYEQELSAVIVACANVIEEAEPALMLPVLQTINTRAALDKKCVDAYMATLEADREYNHADDTVTLIQAEISLWEKGKVTQ